jgi:peptidoglycan lytic transglycosylase
MQRAALTALTIGGLAVLLATGCSTTSARSATPVRLGWEQSGEASWYGVPYHGRQTASGEIYDMYKLTAAHPTLPMGTRVVVTHRQTGRAVEVRINDRGPFKRGRIIDLSYAAAQRLGLVGPGVIPVRIVVVGLADGTRAAGSAPR